MVVSAWNANLFLTLALALFLLSGCTAGKSKPADYLIYSEADTLLNRDAAARPLSVVVNVYQLRDRQTFTRLTFEDFAFGKSDADLLREDLLQKTEIVVLPGEKRSVDAKLLPDTAYLGVVALYREPAEQQWRYLIPAQQIRKRNFWGFSKEKTLSIRLHDCHMTTDGVEIDVIPGQKPSAIPTCTAQTQTSATGISK